MSKAKAATQVAVEQVWESCDPRDKGRRIRIEKVLPFKVLVTNVKTGKKSVIAIDRLKPGGTGYRLVSK